MTPRSADRKAQILDAAVARIAAGGLEGLRVRDVAGDVGINNATLHHHFPTKAALVVALVERFLAGFSGQGGVPPTGAGKDASLEARLAAYVASRRAMMVRDPAPFVVMGELMVLARRDGEVRSLLAGLQERWGSSLAAACREAGLDEAAALDRAHRCRREILGLILDLGLRRAE